MIAGVIFTIVAATHLARLILKWDFVFGGYSVPMWVSVVGVVIPGYLAYEGFRLSRKANS